MPLFRLREIVSPLPSLRPLDPAMGKTPAYLRPREVADLIGVTERTIRRWLANGTLPSVKIGGARLVAVPVLEDRLSPALDLDDDE